MRTSAVFASVVSYKQLRPFWSNNFNIIAITSLHFNIFIGMYFSITLAYTTISRLVDPFDFQEYRWIVWFPVSL